MPMGTEAIFEEGFERLHWAFDHVRDGFPAVKMRQDGSRRFFHLLNHDGRI